MREPVDAVITWVDGYEKAHADKLTHYLTRMGIVNTPEAASPTRFNQCGEIDYCVKSILRFAPWIRSIYIVTDAQRPAIIEQFVGTPEEEKIKLIDHRDIFRGYEDCLPTFNSMTIECMLWRIPGLSNQFIYLNDDCAIVRPVAYEDFFREGKIVLRGHWRAQSDRKWGRYLQRFINKLFNTSYQFVQRDQFRTIEENTAKRAGWPNHFFEFQHGPFSLKRDSFEEHFSQHPEMWSQNLLYPLRDQQQFWPISLIDHLEIKKKNVVFDHSLAAIMVNGGFHSSNKIQLRLAEAENKKQVAFVCFQSVDEASSEVQTSMMGWLDNQINRGNL